jgi:acetyl/propionyl-CoA carboxylase alpha subunit
MYDADEAVCIGRPSNLSHLKMSNIIAAAEITNADAIHPGYFFLKIKIFKYVRNTELNLLSSGND